jgi:hypothetical protein
MPRRRPRAHPLGHGRVTPKLTPASAGESGEVTAMGRADASDGSSAAAAGVTALFHGRVLPMLRSASRATDGFLGASGRGGAASALQLLAQRAHRVSSKRHGRLLPDRWPDTTPVLRSAYGDRSGAARDCEARSPRGDLRSDLGGAQLRGSRKCGSSVARVSRRCTRERYQPEPTARSCGASSRTTGTLKACETGRRRAGVARTVMVGSLANGGAYGSGGERCARPGMRRRAGDGSARGS